MKDDVAPVNISNIKLASPPSYKLGDAIATRVAYGSALVKIAQSNPRVIALDGDMKNSTYAENLKKYDPTRYIECFIAEQNMVGVAIGATCRDRTVAFVSTFSAFITRAYDQVMIRSRFLDSSLSSSVCRSAWPRFPRATSTSAVLTAA